MLDLKVTESKMIVFETFSPFRTREDVLGTGVKATGPHLGFGGVNDSSLLFVYSVSSVWSHHPPHLSSTHPRDTTQPGTSSPCQEISTPRRNLSSQNHLAADRQLLPKLPSRAIRASCWLNQDDVRMHPRGV